MASPEELHLDKLEIAPSLPQIKLLDSHLPLSLNPFYEEDGGAGEREEVDVPALAALTPPQNSCHNHTPRTHKCRQRRRSESVLDDYKGICRWRSGSSGGSGETASSSIVVGATNEPSSSSTTTPRSTPGVQRQTTFFKKSAASLSTGARGKLLRDPVLRALQPFQCSSGVRRKLLAAGSGGGGDKTGTLEAPAPAEITAAAALVDGAGTMSDFRDLISECRTLLGSEVVGGGGFKRRNFTTLRQTAASAAAHHSKSITHTTRTVSPAPLSQEQGSGSSARVPPLNTSCSQQAGAGVPPPLPPPATTADDVTIDELASYFDTLVHIPKKMSSMAEMMYI